MRDVKLSRVAAIAGVAGLLLVLCATLQAQSILGTWQGKLPVAENSRIILKFTKAEDGGLHGVFYRIDQYADSLPLSSVSFVAPDVAVAFDVLSVSYRGKLSADGKSITGVWTQANQTFPLTFSLTAPENVWKREGAVALAPMSATADPAFEVATVKPSAPNATQEQIHASTRHFEHKNATVADMIEFVYKVKLRQIEGGPAWIDETRFDVAGEPDVEGQPSPDQFRLMEQKLLAERFQLKVHSIQKVFPVYAIKVEKNPPKLSRRDPAEMQHDGIITRPGEDGQMRAQFIYTTMPEFANLLMNFIKDRHIVDETGLSGPFDFTVSVPMAAVQGGPGVGLDDNDKAVAFFQALEPLGLKLVAKKATLDVVVVDRLERPSAN